MNQQSRLTRQWLQKQLQSTGIQAEPAALAKLTHVIEQVDEPEQFMHILLDDVETHSDDRKITAKLVDDIVARLDGQGTTSAAIHVVDAFDVPLVRYDPIRKLFHQVSEKRRIFADGMSKVQLFVDRFLLVQQRMRRHRLFRPMQWNNLANSGRAARDVAELTELKALLGLVGERRFVTGVLTRQDEGRYFIEDLSARLPLDLTGAEKTDGLFTENCIVVAEGELTPANTFRAFAVGLPPAEPRAESLSALQGLDFFGGPRRDSRPGDEDRWRDSYEGDRVVILSDVFLDRADVLEKLRIIFEGFAALEPPPSTFVLMGNFQSYDANTATANFARIKENFAALGRVIARFPSILNHSRFVLVPGPGDVGPGKLLPRPGVLKAVAQPLLDAVPGVVLASNPCRLRHGPRELVLFRSNLQRAMRGLCILPPPEPPAEGDADADGDGSTQSASSFMFDQLCATVLQEGHLCPIPLDYQPIAWEYDHSLWVYPQPHGLVLADTEPAARGAFDGCCCLNPGSLAEGLFGAWNPVDNDMELCDVEATEEQEEEEVEEEEEVLGDEGGNDGGGVQAIDDEGMEAEEAGDLERSRHADGEAGGDVMHADD